MVRYLNWNRLLHPQPVYLIISKLGEKVNIMTAAWVSPVSFNPPLLIVSISPKRYTYEIIRKTGEFVVSTVSKDLLNIAYYCGSVSGRTRDKVKDLGLNLIEFKNIGVPYLANSYASLGCKVEKEVEVGDHVLFVGRVVEMHYDQELFKKGFLDVSKIDVLFHLGGRYYTTSSRNIIEV